MKETRIDLATLDIDPVANRHRIVAVHVDVLAALVAAVRASRAFLDKVVVLEPAVNDAFAFKQNHGITYDGPNYSEEKSTLTTALLPFTDSQEDARGR